jgi:hypothetical protein
MHLKQRLSAIAAVIVVAAALMIPATSNMHAQDPYTCDAPCGGDSTTWPWTYPPGPISAMLPINGCQFNTPPTCCTVTAHYRYRQVCGNPGFFQLEILDLSWDKTCAPSFDPVPMIKVITYTLLIQNPMSFPPRVTTPTDTCMSNYTVQAATCWKNIPGMKAAENCGVDTAGYACCRGGYKVCLAMGSNGLERRVTWLGQSTAFNNCVEPCTPSCGAFNDDGIWNKRGDDPPSISMTSTRGASDSVSTATQPVAIEPNATIEPQQR